MDSFHAALLLLLGLLAGATAAWFVLRSAAADAVRLAQSEQEAQHAGLNARLEAREQRLAELQLSAEKTATETARIQSELQRESERRSAAERSKERLPVLEAKLDELQRENQNLRSRLAESEARAEEERKAATEKIALFAGAEKKLSEAFKALSSEALKSNNQSFLELAKPTLEKFQEGAKTDLE